MRTMKQINRIYRSFLPRQTWKARYCLPRLECLEGRFPPAAHDTLMTALSLNFDSNNMVQLSGALATPDQVDIYAVQLNAGDEVSANVTSQSTGGSSSFWFRAFDGTGKQLAFQENFASTSSLPIFDALATGNYYVGISSSGNSSYDPNTTATGNTGNSTGSYLLVLTLSPGKILIPPSDLPNYTFKSAQVIQGNKGDTTISGHGVLNGTNVDGTTAYYKFAVGDTGSLTATVMPNDSNLFLPRLSIYNDKGKLLIQADGVPGQPTAQLNQNLVPGDYYLGISSVPNLSNQADGQGFVLATTYTLAQQPFQPISGGIGAEGITAGDFNHDGNIDLVTANFDSSNNTDNNVQVSLGNGDGTFQSPISYSVNDGTRGVGPASLAVGDFNNDGNLDIVTGNYTDNTISVLLGNGDGTFQSAATYYVGPNPYAVAVGNINGYLDIITANINYDRSTQSCGPGTISVLLGDGKGNFATARNYSVGTEPESVAIEDFNGVPCIVTANKVDNTISLLQVDGNGELLEPAITYRVGQGPKSVAVGTINGKLTLVTANYTDSTVSVLTGTQSNQLQLSETYKVGVYPSTVLLGEINGQLSIVTTNSYSNSISVLLGNGDGSFEQASSYPIGKYSLSAVLADFNNDQRLDIATANFSDGTISILLGKSDGGFESPPTISVGNTPLGVATGDFNNDYNQDIVTANAGDNTISVLLGNGGGTFQAAIAYTVGTYPVAVAVGDLNNDGNQDLVVANYGDGTISVLLGLGDGSFLPATTYKVGKNPYSVAIGDFANNGILDLVTSNSGDNTVSVLLGMGDGTFYTAETYQVGTKPDGVALGDFGNNGKLDIVTSNAGDNSVSILSGLGNGKFQVQSKSIPVGNNPQNVAVGTFNGNLDIVTVNSGYNPNTGQYDNNGTISVLLGDGKGNFQQAESYLVGDRPEAVAVGKVTQGNNLDIVVVNSYEDSVSVLLGNGDGTFKSALTQSVGDDPFDIALSDFNNDGNLDIVTANRGNNSVSVLLGTGSAPFQNPDNITVGQHPQSIVLDYDSNSNDVIVTTNSFDKSVSVLLGNPDGTVFQSAVPYMVGNHPDAVGTLTDSNSNLDIAVANEGDNTVSVLLGNASDTFKPGDTYFVGNKPVALATGTDANSNDIIATANAGDNTVSILIGTQDGTNFQLAGNYPVGHDPDAIAVGTDSKNNPDIFVANYLDNTITVLLGSPVVLPDGLTSDTFSYGGTYSVGKNPSGIAITYVGNASNDFLVTSNENDESVSVLIGNPDGTEFQNSGTYPVDGKPTSIAIGTDSHGNVDIVTANSSNNTVTLLPGNADGTTFQSPATYAVNGNPTSIDIGQDSNSNLTIVTSNVADNSVTILQGNTQFRVVDSENGIAPRHVPFFQDLTGAVNDKGQPIPDELILNSAGDLLFRQGMANSNQYSPEIPINSGTPVRDVTEFQTPAGWSVAAISATSDLVLIYSWDSTSRTFQLNSSASFATGQGPVRIAAADLNGDGLDDLVVANDFDNSVSIAFQLTSGGFSSPLVCQVGSAPADIRFANLGGSEEPDIVVADQASGDFTILFNDSIQGSDPTFAQQSRYRAGGGLFDIDTTTGQQNVLSPLQTENIVAADFQGYGSDDLIVVNRLTSSFTLLPNLGDGVFGDPISDNSYATSSDPGEALSILIPGDVLPSVAILMKDLNQIWIYRNLGNGTFATPDVNAGTVISAGNSPSGFSFIPEIPGPALRTNPAEILVGNSYGDILTLLYHQGTFSPDRSNLQKVPLTIADSNGDVILADQQGDAAFLVPRIPGTTQFDTGKVVPIDNSSNLLAPGAVQIFSVPINGVTTTYLAVANSLSNNVLLYQELGTGQFSSPISYSVGDDPVSITVADLNNDGIPDLAVVNNGSNDISILIGNIQTGAWKGTNYQRLTSGGIGPISVAVANNQALSIPDLVVTNSNGKIITMPGIGSSGKGSGFFQDSNTTLADLGQSIISTVFNGAGQGFLIRGDGGISFFSGGLFVSILAGGPGIDVTALALGDGLLVAALADGTVDLLTTSGSEVARAFTGFTDIPSAIDLLQGAHGLDGLQVYLTQQGSVLPLILTGSEFIPVLTNVAMTSAGVQATGITASDLILVATLITGNLVEKSVLSETIGPSEEIFAVFLPNSTAPVHENRFVSTEEEPEIQSLIPFIPDNNPSESSQPFNTYRLEAEQALKQYQLNEQLSIQLDNMWHQFKPLWPAISNWVPSPLAPKPIPFGETSAFFSFSPPDTDVETPLSESVPKIGGESVEKIPTHSSQFQDPNQQSEFLTIGASEILDEKMEETISQNITQESFSHEE